MFTLYQETSSQKQVLHHPIHPTLQLKLVMRELQVLWLPSSYNGPVKQEKRHLPEDLQSLGKMLVCGTYKQIAHAAWDNRVIFKHLQILAVKQVDNECHNLLLLKRAKLFTVSQ